MVHYLKLHHFNAILFPVPLLMLRYFNASVFNAELFEAALFTVALCIVALC